MTPSVVGQRAQAVAEQLGLGLDVDCIPHNSQHPADDWSAGATHWRCVLRGEAGDGFETTCSLGSAHTDPPTVGLLLASLALDSRSVHDHPDFDDWVDEQKLPMDTAPNRRFARESFEVCRETDTNLQALLGRELHRFLLQGGPAPTLDPEPDGAPMPAARM